MRPDTDSGFCLYLVTPVACGDWPVGVILLHRRRRGMILLSPGMHDVPAHLLGCLCLVQPLEVAVVPLIQLPSRPCLYPGLPSSFQSYVASHRGSLQHRRVGHIESGVGSKWRQRRILGSGWRDPTHLRFREPIISPAFRASSLPWSVSGTSHHPVKTLP